MINGLNTDYKQSDRSNKVCNSLCVCMRTIKRMLALALKVCTQRMFIISEAHQSCERKNIRSAWDATFLVCSEENTI